MEDGTGGRADLDGEAESGAAVYLRLQEQEASV